MSLSKWPPGGHIDIFGCRSDSLQFGFEYQLQTSFAHYVSVWVEVYWFLMMSFPKRPPGGHSRLFCFRTILIWHWISTPNCRSIHYNDVIMSTLASQITSLTIVYSTVYSGADQRKHQSSASLAFVWIIHREPVNSPHKGPVTRKTFPFDDIIMLPAGMGRSLLIFCDVAFKMAALRFFLVTDSNLNLALL